MCVVKVRVIDADKSLWTVGTTTSTKFVSFDGTHSSKTFLQCGFRNEL